jgi:hypothetical protein
VSMTCKVSTIAEFAADQHRISYVREHLTMPDGDFGPRIDSWLTGVLPVSVGHIATVEDCGEIIGWARTEKWQEWDTLEAFVSQPYRYRGIAAFASAGLVAAALNDNGLSVAVFSPPMLLVAKRAGLLPVLFAMKNGHWTQQ